MLHLRRTPHALDVPPAEPARTRTAFVLSGGGNQGVVQVGQLQALLDHGIVPDVVVGCSAGALNGAALAYAPNRTGLDRLASVWSNLTTNDVFPGGKFSRAWNVVRKGPYLFANDGLAGVVERATPARSFSDLAVPLRVVAADLDSGDEVVFCRGPLAPALMASAALPGVFPVIAHDGRRLVDGGVVDSVPLWHALAGPVDRVFVLNVSHSVGDRAIRTPLDVVMASFAHSRNMRYELDRRLAPEHVEIVELPRPNDDREIFDFSRGPELIAAARSVCDEALDAYLDGRVVSTPEDSSANRRLRVRFARKPVARPSAAAPAA